jgi:hypothetical protein
MQFSFQAFHFPFSNNPCIHFPNSEFSNLISAALKLRLLLPHLRILADLQPVKFGQSSNDKAL